MGKQKRKLKPRYIFYITATALILAGVFYFPLYILQKLYCSAVS